MLKIITCSQEATDTDFFKDTVMMILLSAAPEATNNGLIFTCSQEATVTDFYKDTVMMILLSAAGGYEQRIDFYM